LSKQDDTGFYLGMVVLAFMMIAFTIALVTVGTGVKFTHEPDELTRLERFRQRLSKSERREFDALTKGRRIDQ